MYEIVNKQVKFTQHIGTCKSAYTNGFTLNWALTIDDPLTAISGL